MLKQLVSQAIGVLYPHAAMTISALGIVKEFFCWEYRVGRYSYYYGGQT